MNLKNVLGQIQTDGANLLHGTAPYTICTILLAGVGKCRIGHRQLRENPAVRRLDRKHR
jgi:hypothetical protein